MSYRLMWILLNKNGEVLQVGGEWVLNGLTRGKVFMKLISTTKQTEVFKSLFGQYPEADIIQEVQTNGDNYQINGMRISRVQFLGAK